MSDLLRAIQTWGSRFDEANRAKAIEMMSEMAELIEEAVNDRHYGPIDSHGITFAVEGGAIGRRKLYGDKVR